MWATLSLLFFVWSFCFILFFQIGDFGMARDLEEDEVYISQGGKMPLKWTAPEVRERARVVGQPYVDMVMRRPVHTCVTKQIC